MDLEKLFRRHPLQIGKRYKASGRGDQGIVAEARRFIGEEVTVIQKLKSGLYIIQLPTGETHSWPKSAIDPLETETYDYPQTEA